MIRVTARSLPPITHPATNHLLIKLWVFKNSGYQVNERRGEVTDINVYINEAEIERESKTLKEEVRDVYKK